MDAVLGPESAGWVGDALVVESAGDVQDAPARLGHAEDALHDGRGGGVGFQCGPLLSPVLYHELAVAVGHPCWRPRSLWTPPPASPGRPPGQDFRCRTRPRSR